MRISTSQIYDAGVDSILKRQADLLRTQQMVSTGKKFATPSEDPVAAARLLVIQQAQARNEQYGDSIGAASDSLGMTESTLAGVTSLLQEVRDLAVAGGGGALSDADRASMATELAGKLDALIGLANDKDGEGNYLFSGFRTSTRPFALAGGTVVYGGDDGVRTMDVAPGRNLAVAENGNAVFMRVPSGNGTFTTAPGAGNTGSGVIDAGQVVAAGSLTGHTYRLQFNVAAGATTYDVYDVTAGGGPISAGNAYASGSAIAVAGMQVTVSGDPAGGDTFTLAPSSSKSIFRTVQDLIATLRTPATGSAGKAAIANGIGSALVNIDQGLESVLGARAGVGTRLRELDGLKSSTLDRNISLEQQISTLVDVDYNQALSDFARQQLALEAAQKSFAAVSGLSLFKFL
jgi:flagellar hook-associated protein 3 FlgL